MWLTRPNFCCLLLLAATSFGWAEDDGPSQESIRAATTRSLPLLVAGAKGSLEQRKHCFTCHNQGLPIFALTTARSRGYEIDEPHLQTQLQSIVEFLAKNKSRYLEGQGQGGQADMAGYALWTLEHGGWKPDDTTAAVTEYFLQFQRDSDHWEPVSHRPPSENSPFTTTFVSLRGLQAFGAAGQQPRINERVAQAREWLKKTPAQDTEDRVFRLWGLTAAGAGPEDVGQASAELSQTQRADGGWSQLPELESDAYATGSALVALRRAGGLATATPVYRRGLKFLLAAQHDDGSWHVASRSKPFQTYFESGYPHGKDQFISIAAAGWATTALLLALREETPVAQQQNAPSPELLRATLDAIGGQDKILKLFRYKERLAVTADPQAPGKERVSVCEPPAHWWQGTRDRVTVDKEPATFLVWGWTLGVLVDPKSKLTLLDDITIDDKPAHGIRVSETVTPAMDLYFDQDTKRLVCIDWRNDRHRFSDWKETAGVSYAAKCVGYKRDTGKRWYHTEILDLEPLTELPEGLQR